MLTDRNVMQKEAEKKLKYKSSRIEIQQMRDLKCRIMPVIIGATRIVTKGLRKNLEVIPGKQSIHLLQKTAVLGTSHIIWKVLQPETCSMRNGDHHWFERSTRKKGPVETMTMMMKMMIIIIIINESVSQLVNHSVIIDQLLLCHIHFQSHLD